MQSLTIKEITVQEVIDAIEQNGFEHVRSRWITYSDGKIVGACVLGQGAVNLGTYTDEEQFMNEVNIYDIEKNSYSNIGSGPTLYDQLNRFSVPKDSRWYIENFKCGSTIVEWNDKKSLVYGQYALPTYADVLEMVKEVLAEYVDEILYLAVREYSFNARS